MSLTNLGAGHVGKETQRRQSEHDGNDDRQRIGQVQPAIERCDEGRQGKGQQNGEHQWHKDTRTQIEQGGNQGKRRYALED